MKNEISKPKDIYKLSYVDFMALIEERNRPPGGKDSVRRIAINTFLTPKSRVLHVGCNTGISTRLISSYTKCRAIGVDISPSMISVAKKITREENLNKIVSFEVQNAEKLKFKSSTFDLVFSAGSIAFINSKQRVINEGIRVLKEYGFFADTPMYYKKDPPTKLIRQLNTLMTINIQKWGLSFWENLYSAPKLNKYYMYLGEFKIPSIKDICLYCNEMTQPLSYKQTIKSAINERLFTIMKLFLENHKYLAYAVLIYQKASKKEQVSLFGK